MHVCYDSAGVVLICDADVMQCLVHNCTMTLFSKVLSGFFSQVHEQNLESLSMIFWLLFCSLCHGKCFNIFEIQTQTDSVLLRQARLLITIIACDCFRCDVSGMPR